MGGKKERRIKLLQRILVRDQSFDGEATRKDQLRGARLKTHVRAIAAEDFLFLDAHGRGGEFDAHLRVVLGEKEDAASRAGEGQRFGNQSGNGDGEKNDISPTTTGTTANLIKDIRCVGIKGSIRSKTQAGGPAFGHQVGGENRSSRQLAEPHEEQADRALSNDHNGLAGSDASFFDGLEAGIDRLDEGGFDEADPIGNLDHAAFDNPRHRLHIFGKAAAVGSKAGRQTHPFIKLALREQFALAVETVAAGNVMETDDPVAGSESGDTCAHGDDCAGHFVPEDLWRGNETMLDLLDVGATNAAGGDADQKFSRSDFGNGDLFDDDVILAAIHRRSHDRRDGLGQRNAQGRRVELSA